MNKNKPSETTLLEQYKELNSTARHYDHQFWIIPGLFLTVSAGLYAVISNIQVSLIKCILSWTIPLVGFGLVLQMINERAYQLKNKARTKVVRDKLGLDKIKDGDTPNWAKWWIKRINFPLIMIIFMILIIVVEIIIANHLNKTQ